MFTKRSVLTLLSLILLLSSLLFPVTIQAATDIAVPHISDYGGWIPALFVYNSQNVPVTFQLQRYDDAGALPPEPLQYEVLPKQWFAIPLSDLSYTGWCRITSSTNLIVKSSFTNGETNPLKCIFLFTPQKSKFWTVVNEQRADFTWSGFAVAFPTTSSYANSVTLIAYKDGVEVARKTEIIQPNGHFVRMSNQIWDGIGYHDFDMCEIVADQEVSVPMMIMSEDTLTNYNFFLGTVTPLSAEITWTPKAEGSAQGQLDCTVTGGTGTYQYYWDFKDPTAPEEERTSEEKSPSHSFMEKRTYTVELTVYSSDLQEYTVTKDIVVTDIPPTVEFQGIADGQTVSGTGVHFQIISSDDKGVEKVEYYQDNVLINTRSISPWNIWWNTTGSPNGVHVLKAIAFDNIGQKTEKSISVIVQN